MSFDFVARDSAARLDFSDLVDAASSNARTSIRRNRKAQKQGAKQRLAQASMLAPLLALEGCYTIGGNDGPLKGGEDRAPDGGDKSNSRNGGGTATPPVTPAAPVEPSAIEAFNDDHFHTDAGEGIQIAADDLLSNDIVPEGVSAQLVRVFGATHGTVMLHDGAVHFTPEAGYEGEASFQYEVRDSNGNLSRAQVEVHVGPQDGMDDGHDGMDMGDHGDMGDMPAGDDHSHVHPDDPMKASEHMAVLNLVPVEEATHIAVNNGSWFDPNTWASGEVPGEGAKVVIPDGVDVTYDGESAVSLFTVRVDGSLDFATDRDTFMEVDTFVVAPTGKLTIGTIDQPVSAGVETVIQFADNGPIDVSWDPMLLSRGLISHGDIQIHGAEKETFLKVAADPMAGDTSLTLESSPEGWQVGDKLVLTGTHLTPTEDALPLEPRNDQTQDEELVITKIEGNTIYFDKPLEFDHDGARADLKAYVANYSRNVRFETENADSLPVHQRGHTMFMHSDNIDVRYAEFYELGRTDKSERAFEAADADHLESDSNVKARYSLHIHRAGVSDVDDPAMIVGNAVWGSPGWGYVHHDSNAVLADNAAYDVYGAAFVAESGNEIGRWSHNISIKSIGNGGGPKWHEDVTAGDMGRTGAGFWFQGRLVEAVDNVAAGVPGGQGFVYMSRGGIYLDPNTAHLSESFGYHELVANQIPAITQFEGNEAFAVGTGLIVIKNNSEQHHDVRTVIDDFKGWEVGTGIHLEYTAHYTLKDIDLVATDGSAGRTAWRGIEYGPAAVNMVINGADVEGFPVGVYLMKDQTGMNHPFDGDWGYVFIDVNVEGAAEDYYNLDGKEKFLTRADLVEGRLEYESTVVGIPDTPVPNTPEYIDLTGVRTDEIGEDVVSPSWDPIRHNYFTLRIAIQEEGYWTLPDGRTVVVMDQYFADRATGAIDKVGVVVEWTYKLSDASNEGQELKYNGVLDLSSDAPVARTDFVTLDQNGSVTFDVLANDFDPDGDTIAVDGVTYASHGSIFENEDGTLTYMADPNYSGSDEFWYWVEDDNGNFTKGHVQVTVEV